MTKKREPPKVFTKSFSKKLKKKILKMKGWTKLSNRL